MNTRFGYPIGDAACGHRLSLVYCHTFQAITDLAMAKLINIVKDIVELSGKSATG